MTRLNRRKRTRAKSGYLEALEHRILFSFGYTHNSDGSFTIDTGASTVFTIGATGNMTSLLHGTTQLIDPVANGGGHFESGLSSNAVLTINENATNGTIVLKCDDTGSSGVGVIQYYIAKSGSNAVYMDTYAPSWPGEMRYIVPLKKTVLTSVNTNTNPSNYSYGNENLESADTVKNTTTGYTYSKFYGMSRMLDPGSSVWGATGSGNGVFFNVSSHEKNSGGPFFRDIQQATNDTNVSLSYYMWSDHAQLEPESSVFRKGLQAPYSLVVTSGGSPAAVDYSFFDNLGLPGYTPASGRGSVSGTATTHASGINTVVALANPYGEYWATCHGGTYSITGVLPGTYTATIYQGELAVGTQSVTVTAGHNSTLNMVDVKTQPTAIWTIGTWDGTPLEFMNGSKFATMHPSDSRMSPWNPVTYTVGSSATSSFPAAQWKDIGNIPTIKFTLTAAQAAESLTLRIGSTTTFGGGRDYIVVNNNWTSPTPSSYQEADGRNLVHGTYRGFNHAFDYTIPAGVLVAGTNTISLNVTAGSDEGGYLSPSIAYDAVDLVVTSSLTSNSIGT